jgi:MFS family permease
MYWINAAFQVVQFINFSTIHLAHDPRRREPMTRKSLLAGVRFVTANKIILGAITLDMFAVLFGGAKALMPLYATDILHAGSWGFGLMLAAPSVGALSMGITQAYAPPMKNAGRNLLWAVAGFGVATIVFGLSRNLVLSLVALFFTGVFDNISVVVRHTLVQLLTPDTMRGRVNAVNSVFISCSNELGDFESGITADAAKRFLGPVMGPMAAVAAGGVGTILVVAAVAWAWPQVRTVKKLGHLVSEEPPEPQGFPVEINPAKVDSGAKSST